MSQSRRLVLILLLFFMLRLPARLASMQRVYVHARGRSSMAKCVSVSTGLARSEARVLAFMATTAAGGARTFQTLRQELWPPKTKNCADFLRGQRVSYWHNHALLVA